jgi:hypothetical protein
VKRLLGLVVGGLGLGALLRRRRAPASSPADDLRERLAAAKSDPVSASADAPAAVEPVSDTSHTPEPEPAADEESDPLSADRRAQVHERARRAIDELRER